MGAPPVLGRRLNVRPARTSSDPGAQAEATRRTQERLIAALRDPARFGPACRAVRVIETHISYVLLTGRHVYKIKKAVDLGFLDFTALAARRHYCELELRLNRRTAPGLYLDVVAITGPVERPAIDGAGDVLEWAVRMREFSQDALLSRVLARGELGDRQVDALAANVAAFHARVARAGAGARFGAPDDALDLALANFAAIRPLADAARDDPALDALETWTTREHAACRPALAARRDDGSVRECHGDLHLDNIALVDGEITPFDCIEFNERMRWIDVMSEVAFTTMDLASRGHPEFARRFRNAYLEITGDYGGVAVLRFFLVYRAMVRAKVAFLRSAQESGSAAAAERDEGRRYIALAQSYAEDARPAIVLMHGLSGCGKTTLSQALLERIDAVRIRTDVERKRLAGLAASAAAPAEVGGGLYAPDATRATYERVRDLAAIVAHAGFVALADGAFLQRWQRRLFADLASGQAVAFAIVDCVAAPDTLQARIAARAAHGTDASDADAAVLLHQLRTREPLGPDEAPFAVTYDAERPLADAHAPDAWRGVEERIGLSGAEDGEADLPALADKAAFLARPESYPEGAQQVVALETHMSWVFQDERYAWKLKKPLRTPFLDFRNAAARRHNCFAEMRLNRRLAPDVYLAVVPLTRAASGALQLGPDGAVVDWLVKMRRLPASRMLDRMIRERTLATDALRGAIDALSDFYRASPAVETSGPAYRRRIADDIAATGRELARAEFAMAADRVDALRARQLALLDHEPALFDARVEAGHVVEGHGDLRPEHICLEDPPRIIDCLEFSRELRTLDVADELGFLALECERLGAAHLREAIFAFYTARTRDAPPDRLVHFYQSYRAAIRAKIALWHLEDPAFRSMPKWRTQADTYLELGLRHIERVA